MRTIIFDFDGTIADSMPVIIAIYQELLPGKHALDSVEIGKLRHMPLQKVAAHLGISLWKVPFLLRRGRKLMHDRVPSIAVFENMPEVFKELQAQGYELRVLSSNSTENVQLFLNNHGLDSYFVEAKGISGLFGKGRALKKMLKARGISKQDAIYVGDEVRDITAARKAGIPIISVTWGFNDEALLSDMKPDYLARAPKDLLDIIKSKNTK